MSTTAAPQQLSSETTTSFADLWMQYWSGHPLVDVWHCQTFARMTAKNFASSASSWSPEIKKVLETVSTDVRVKQLRTFFARQQQTSDSTKQPAVDAAAAASASGQSQFQLLPPSCVIEISTSSSSLSSSPITNHLHPRDVFDLYQTLLISTKDQQQTTILDFEFVAAGSVSASASSSSSSSCARITFATPLVAQRVASSLQGVADVKILPASTTSIKPHKNASLLIRGLGLANLYNQIRASGFSLLFAIFGESPKIEVVSASPLILRVAFPLSQANSEVAMVAPKCLQLSPEEEFFIAAAATTTSNEDAATPAAPSSTSLQQQVDKQ